MLTAPPGRRSFLAGLSSLLALAASPRSTGAQPLTPYARFSHEDIVATARGLSSRPYVRPATVPETLRKLTYDLYRQIRFRKDGAIWGKSPSRFAIELFPPGFLYQHGIDVSIVENGKVLPIRIDENAFEFPSPEIGTVLAALGKFAGFRLHYPINRPDYKDEFVVFQGASYFRAVSRGQNYGLSARGLAIDVAEPGGEEFPSFTRFWIERASANTSSIVVHALLDSPRVAGAYRFGIYPGAPTIIDVDLTLFPREPLAHVGLGALTSMFLFGPVDRAPQVDYRPAVHDSIGLALHTGNGERIWRPLNNPRRLQVSAFVDRNPRGFGLVQRDRRFNHFQDLEARYETRPSAWIIPRGDWGPGHVVLAEIPTDSETNDNIVAYWRPEAGLVPGRTFNASYRITWPGNIPATRGISPVIRSAAGRTFDGRHNQMVIDYAPVVVPSPETIRADASISRGKLLETVTQPNPETGGFRVFVTFDPGQAEMIEFRVQPRHLGKPVGETWLYRWTPA
jgi:periplasmic glucans biosynthesis protein